MDILQKYIIPGKKMAIFFYMGGWLRNLVPSPWIQYSRRKLLKNWESREDAEYIKMRRDFYCRNFTIPLSEEVPVDEVGSRITSFGDVKVGNFQSRYAIDAAKYLRYWSKDKKMRFLDGDIRKNPLYPTILKARRIGEPGYENAVILNLDSIRHFLNPLDKIPFRNKESKLFFRGDIYRKPARIEFFRRWADHPLCDLGDTNSSHPSEWSASIVPIPYHFRYRFILALEGYDVASSLQWIMASNCVPVMPRPTAETWLMHSRMQPGVHYVEISPDFSDVGEKIEYYTSHLEEAEKIAMESKEWARQFFNRKREKLVSLLVIEKYLKLTGQLPDNRNAENKVSE